MGTVLITIARLKKMRWTSQPSILLNASLIAGDTSRTSGTSNGTSTSGTAGASPLATDTRPRPNLHLHDEETRHLHFHCSAPTAPHLIRAWSIPTPN